MKHLGGVYAAYQDGILDLRPDPRALGRRPLIINAESKVLLELSDAAAAAGLEIACDLADPRRAAAQQIQAEPAH